MLTAKQHRLLLYIDDCLKKSGISPSFDEMKDALGLKSKSGIHRLIGALEERGFLRRLPNRARALEVVKLPAEEALSPAPATSSVANSATNVVKGRFGPKEPALYAVPETSSIPLHGRIAAGTPIEALENVDTYVEVPASMTGNSSCYALEVSGDSMVELGILDGDTVVIEAATTARDGEIVVALVDDREATLKTLKRSGGHIALVPANRDHETQIFEASRVRIQGKLAGLLRQYH